MSNNNDRLPLVDIAKGFAASNRSETYRYLLGIAVRAGAVPEVVDCSALPTAVIRLSPSAKAKLDQIADQFSMTRQSAFAGLCLRGLAIQQKQQRQQAERLNWSIVPAVTTPFTPKSLAQKRYYEQIMIGLNADKIVFAEGSTGIGKSRVMTAAAIQMVKSGKTPVVIAAPTIAVMEHLHEEISGLDTDGIRYTALAGTGEFVDDLALRKYILAAEDDPSIIVDPEVSEWVKRGAPALDPQAPLPRALGQGAAWLMSDLHRLARNMPTDDFSLRSRPQTECGARSESAVLVEIMRARAKTGADIIFCTHTMLALGQLTQWQALPKPCVVIIDEAHLFEQAVASVNSDVLSLYGLRVSLSRYQRNVVAEHGLSYETATRQAVAGQALKETLLLMKLFGGYDIPAGEILCLTNLQDDDARQEQALVMLRALRDKLVSKTLNDMPMVERYRVAIRAIVRDLEMPVRYRHNRVELSFSPDRRYPSLSCGPSRVDGKLRHIWDTAKGGVVLSSATLFIVDQNGNNKCDYMRNMLAVDFSRIVTPPPINEKHLYTLPELFIPSPEQSARLIPSNEQGSEALAQWYAELARAIRAVIDTAKGGTLALFTSYATINAVATELERLGVDPGRLIMQSPSRKFIDCERVFRQVYAQGARPILLGVGTVWTGVDLKDHNASDEDDLLLTDLVVTRLPINLNRSNSQIHRVERMGWYPIVNECLLTFRQGLGRLIRRDKVKHRRIWVLDGRIFADVHHPWMAILTASIRRLLRQYTRRREFSLPQAQ